MQITILDQRANYEDSIKLLKEKNLKPLTYQQALVAIDKDAELKNNLKGKWFYLEGKGLESSGHYTFNNKGELKEITGGKNLISFSRPIKAGKGNIEKTVYCWYGVNPLSLGVRTDDGARAGVWRFYLGAYVDPRFVAPVVVGVRSKPLTKAEQTEKVELEKYLTDLKHEQTKIEK